MHHPTDDPQHVQDVNKLWPVASRPFCDIRQGADNPTSTELLGTLLSNIVRCFASGVENTVELRIPNDDGTTTLKPVTVSSDDIRYAARVLEASEDGRLKLLGPLVKQVTDIVQRQMVYTVASLKEGNTSWDGLEWASQADKGE